MNIFNDLRSYSRHWIKEFIETYKSEVCLWQTKHPDYNNNILRNQAYDKLIEKLKEVESEPDRSMVVRKINSLRSAFRREYRKKCLKKHYEPRLWYYDMLSFIADQQFQTKRKGCAGKNHVKPEIGIDITDGEQDMEEERYEEPCEIDIGIKNDKNMNVTEVDERDTHTQQAVNAIETPQPQISTHQTVHISETPAEKEQRTVSFYKPECIPVINSSMFKHEDEFDAVGMNVASKLRSMNNTQRIIAEKLISDVLFSGQLDGLTVSSKIVI